MEPIDRIRLRCEIDETIPFDKASQDMNMYYDRAKSELLILIGKQPIVPTMKWYPYPEEKPNESGMYILTAVSCGEKRTTFALYQKRTGFFVLRGRRAYWRITAWMPLPEPWKGEA